MPQVNEVWERKGKLWRVLKLSHEHRTAVMEDVESPNSDIYIANTDMMDEGIGWKLVTPVA